MRWANSGKILVIITILTITFVNQNLWAVSRTHGLGFRASFWNVTNRPTRIQVSPLGEQAKIDISGAGGNIFFFSRLYQNWFLEFNFGAISALEGETNDLAKESDIKVSSVIPILFGVRYQVLSDRFPTMIHPYLAAGAGPYLGTSMEFKNEKIVETEQTIGADMVYGAYTGGGMNLMLFSWFALNFDLKYHFPDFNRNHQYSGLEFGLGLNAMWGKKQEIFEIKSTKVVVQDIYPTFYQFYNTYPLALVTIKNISSYPIEVNIRCSVKGFSEKPKNSGFVRIERGKTRDIPVTAFLSSRLQRLERRESAILDIEIEAKAGSVYKKEISTEVMVHHRNAWDGDMQKLGFFITPDEENLLDLTRKMNASLPDSMRQEEASSFYLARQIFNELGNGGLHYRRDPNIPFYQDDRVQFATETLQHGTGDCDDLVILLASLLESAGIKTAFVEVRDPEKEIAHLYLLFDTGLSISQISQITTNEKRYLMRSANSRQESAWIPIETTLVGNDFSVAWEAAAKAYLQEGILRNGLTEGWVRIIDIH